MLYTQFPSVFIFLAKIGSISQCTLLLARYNEYNDVSTFLCLPNETICQTLQNTLLFPIELPRSTQNAYHTVISWGLGTDNSRWGPILGNAVDAEAIRHPTEAFLPVQCLMCEVVHCHNEKEFVFFFKCGHFYLISSTNQYNNAA